MAPPPGRAESLGEYYKILGIPFDASEEDIRKQYHSIVRALHPDRRNSGTASGESLDRFHQVQGAWRCLSDPTRRLLYDLRNFGYSSQGVLDRNVNSRQEGEARLLALQRQQAERDVLNMKVQLQRVLRREKASKGVIIRQAIYGDLRLNQDSLSEGLAGTRTLVVDDLVGPVHDVSTPLQCLVEQHTIIVPGGTSASKADLPGFYNPAPLNPEVELSLYVLYEFRGNLHETFVADHETLSLPLRKHAVPATKAPRGPFSPSNVAFLTMYQAEAAGGQDISTESKQQLAGSAVDASRQRETHCHRQDVRATEMALAAAVRSYRFRRLQPPIQDLQEATPREFMVVVATACAAIFLGGMWAVNGKSSGD